MIGAAPAGAAIILGILGIFTVLPTRIPRRNNISMYIIILLDICNIKKDFFFMNIMRCQYCKKKGSFLICKGCKKVCCYSCISLEKHSCIGLPEIVGEKRKLEADNLIESKIEKIKVAKV